jgi:hypothetical protein
MIPSCEQLEERQLMMMLLLLIRNSSCNELPTVATPDI